MLTQGAEPRWGGVTGFYNNVRSVATSRSTGVVILIVVVSLILVTVLSFVVYRFLVSSLKSTTLLDHPVHARTGSLSIDGKQLPSMDNGLEFCVSAWLYSEGAGVNTGVYKDVIRIGDAPCCMLWAMDKTTNRLYIALRLSQAPEASSNYAGAIAAIDRFKGQGAGAAGDATFMVVAVEYLPLQRWVNISVVVTQDIVTLYLDGDIYSVTSADSFMGGSGKNVVPPKGSVMVGQPNTGFNGFVSRLQVFNYTVSVYHARNIYSSGPVKRGLLGYLGLPKYKLQWPIANAEKTCA